MHTQEKRMNTLSMKNTLRSTSELFDLQEWALSATATPCEQFDLAGDSMSVIFLKMQLFV